MRLSRDDFLKAEDNVAEEVDLSDIPGYHGSVLVRGMTGRERDDFELSFQQRGRRGEFMPVGITNLANITARLVSRCVVDDDGNRLFTDADVTALGNKSSAALERLNAVASRLSGIGPKEMQELAEDFGNADGGDSSSTSPSASARRSPNSSKARRAGN
jgi:hypothetical protein